MTQHEKGGLPPDHYFLLKVNATVGLYMARHVITCLCAFVRTLATSIFFGPFCSTEMKQLRQRMREFTNLAFLAACFRDIRDICKDEQGCRCHKHVAFPMHFLHMFLLLVGGGLASLLHATSRLAQSFLLTICLVFNLFACGFALTFFLTAIPFQFHLGLGFIVFHCSPRAAPEQPRKRPGAGRRVPHRGEPRREKSLAEECLSEGRAPPSPSPRKDSQRKEPRREQRLSESQGLSENEGLGRLFNLIPSNQQKRTNIFDCFSASNCCDQGSCFQCCLIRCRRGALADRVCRTILVDNGDVLFSVF